MYRGLTNLFPKKTVCQKQLQISFLSFYSKMFPTVNPWFSHDFPWFSMNFGEIPWFSDFPMNFPKASAPRPAPPRPAPRPVPLAPRRAWCWRCRKRRNRTSRTGDGATFFGEEMGDLWGFMGIWCWDIWLVVWNMAFILVSHHIGNFIIPTDELIFFRGVAQPPTRYNWYN